MWTYFRTPQIEFGIPGHASCAPLKPHVHACAQIMIVARGARRVRLGRQTVFVPANSILIIPPGVAHVAHATGQDGWDGINAYVDPSQIREPAARLLRFAGLPGWTRGTGGGQPPCDMPSLLALIAGGTTVWSDPGLAPFRPGKADLSGWPQSREGRIRRYRREAGIAPHAHFKAMQLDRARRRLAQGEAIAAVAAELGFTDQSHFGRQFRAAFGTSPGRYVSG